MEPAAAHRDALDGDAALLQGPVVEAGQRRNIGDDPRQRCRTGDLGLGAELAGLRVHGLGIEADPEQVPGRFGPRVALGTLTVLAPGAAVRADDVEGPVRVGHALGVELQRLALLGGVDQPDEASGDEAAVPEDRHLRALGLVVGHEADPRKAGLGGAGDPAHVLGLVAPPGLGGMFWVGLAEEFAADRPGLGRVLCRDSHGQGRREPAGERDPEQSGRGRTPDGGREVEHGAAHPRADYRCDRDTPKRLAAHPKRRRSVKAPIVIAPSRTPPSRGITSTGMVGAAS